jgi:hypothetical protein
MTLHGELDRLRSQTAPYDATRLAALDKVRALSNLPGYGGDLWDALDDHERDAVADLFEDDPRTWTEDEGSCDGEGW